VFVPVVVQPMLRSAWEAEMPWRERFIDYLRKERDDLQRRIDNLESRKCEMWETTDSRRKDVTDEYSAGLRSRLAQIDQILVEEGLS
jgi:hypothetical protein